MFLNSFFTNFVAKCNVQMHTNGKKSIEVTASILVCEETKPSFLKETKFYLVDLDINIIHILEALILNIILQDLTLNICSIITITQTWQISP